MVLGASDAADCCCAYPIHEGPIIACPNLLEGVVVDIVSVYFMLADQYVPTAATIFPESTTHVAELSVVRVRLISQEPSFALGWIGPLAFLLLLLPPLAQLSQLGEDAVQHFILLRKGSLQGYYFFPQGRNHPYLSFRSSGQIDLFLLESLHALL